MVARRPPLLPIEDFHVGNVRDPADWHKAEVDVPRFEEVEAVTTGPVGLASVLHAVEFSGSVAFFWHSRRNARFVASGLFTDLVDSTADHLNTDGRSITLIREVSLQRPSVAQEAVVSVRCHRNTSGLLSPRFAALVVALALGSSTAAVAQTGWQSDDIGDVGVGGSAVEDRGVWTIAGAGADVWGTEDGLHFVSQEVAAVAFFRGTVATIVARLEDMQDTHPFAKAGVMLRGIDNNPDSVTALLSRKPNGELEFMYRPAKGFPMQYVTGMFVRGPVWLQLGIVSERTGYGVTAQVSEDGENWTWLGGVGLRETVARAGLFVSSHDRQTLNVAHVSGVRLLPAPFTGTDIGAGQAIVGTVVLSRAVSTGSADRTLLVQAAGTDIWGRADNFFFVRSLSPDLFGLQWTLERFDAGHPFAKAGVMIRHGLDASAESVILDVKPDGGVEFMVRPCYGCHTDYLGGTTVTLPVTLRLVRDLEGVFASVVAADGTVTSLGYAPFPPVDFPAVGVAVTSHDPSNVATAIFRIP